MLSKAKKVTPLPWDVYTPPSCEQLTIDYFQRKRGTKRMVDMFFEFTELCTTIPPLEYGGNEALLEYFESKVKRYDPPTAHMTHKFVYSHTVSFRAQLAYYTYMLS